MDAVMVEADSNVREGLPNNAIATILHFVGPRAALSAGYGCVSRQWHKALMEHPDWAQECIDEGLDKVTRPDGEEINWGAHYLSYAKSSFTQMKVMSAVLNGKNVFMSGPGGCGKTSLVNLMVEKLEEMGVKVHVTATTGMAATLIGGTTLHRFAGCGLAKEPVDELLRRMNRMTRERWRRAGVLVIDEVSMLDADFFEKLDAIGKSIRGNTVDLFGGIQLIVTGDFCQLPPVKPVGKHRFVFQHPLFEKGIDKTFLFEHVFRTNDALFADILSRVRTADHTEEDICILKTRKHASIPEAEALGIIPTRMYAHRASVDSYNAEQLEALEGADRTCLGTITASRRENASDYGPARAYALHAERATTQLLSSCPVAKEMHFRDGAQVMVVVNLDPGSDIVNGSRGVVTDANAPGGIEVLFMTGEKRIITPFKWENKDARGDRGEPIILGFKQVPLILAWAVSIHKCQGATLDAAVADLGPRIFEPGMSYVALSRVRSLKSLSLLGLDPDAIRADEVVCNYYAYIKRHGTHKGFSATVVKMVFPTLFEMQSLVKALPAIKKRRDAARAAREKAEVDSASAKAFLDRRRQGFSPSENDKKRLHSGKSEARRGGDPCADWDEEEEEERDAPNTKRARTD